ncbi:hypothetical protein CCH79_00020259 [Gambusia affinis]|uniref:Soluble scavenger receptor cysteine-rich domain-containing protein SSC5D n=1 Tax=Gambusia affinis TaxID=33528 RepID=A0A315W3V1_GAMAF|nr:hypothetical protein CCH79_00020259 [Gambusia affinis]
MTADKNFCDSSQHQTQQVSLIHEIRRDLQAAQFAQPSPPGGALVRHVFPSHFRCKFSECGLALLQFGMLTDYKNQFHWSGPGETQFRLAGPTRCSGRVEVYHGHAWGTVCDDGWDLSDAAVVCRQLGCGAALSAPTSAYFGQGTGEIWLSDLGCSGTEVSLSECSYTGFGIRTCDHSEDAGATCAGAQIRLAGPTRCSGRVEVLFNGTWGTVCDDSWDLSDAAVVCRQLGCGPPQAALSAASFGEGTGPVWFANMSCSGTEADLTECGHSGFGANRCGHAEDAAVVCGKPVSTRPVSPGVEAAVQGNVSSNRRPGQTGGSNPMELGCDRAYEAPGGAQFGPGTGSIMLDDLVCSGTERSLTDCGHSGFGLQNCDHDEDAGALCEGTGRLQRVVRLKVLQDSSLDLNYPAVLDGFLNQLKQKLQDQELNGNIKLSWMTSHGKIFNKDKGQN